MSWADVTPDKLFWTVGLVLLLIGAYNVIMQAVKTHREEKKIKSAPVKDLTDRVDAHDRMLANDKARLDALDREINDIRTESTMILRGVRAIQSGDEDKIKASSEDIDEYLLSRK